MTETATGSKALLPERETATPLSGAGALRVTVHVIVAPEVRLMGWQVSEERLGALPKVSVTVLETPLRLALMIAV